VEELENEVKKEKKAEGEEGYLVEGVGMIRLDVSSKSWEWREGYFQALMCAVKAAENLEGWVKDDKVKVMAPKEYVASEDNPEQERKLGVKNVSKHPSETGRRCSVPLSANPRMRN
jgi:hypothetical protein